MTIRVIVADDHEVVRSGFAALIETQADLTVVGAVGDGLQAVALCEKTACDVVLMDVRMPVLDGIEATRRIVGRQDGPRVLIMTTFDLDEHVYDALAAGASGFLLKDVTAERMFDAVRVIAAGDALLDPSVTRRLIAAFTSAGLAPPATTIDSLDALTPREVEVLRLVAAGMSNAEIAAILVLSSETVKTHISRTLSKLGLRDRVQAVVAAYESGLVVPRQSD